MPLVYQTPGVYVEEVSTGAQVIEPVGTSDWGAIGVTPLPAHINEPWPVNNWTQFMNEFVGAETKATPLVHAVFGFFQNGGRRCYIVNLGDDGPISGEGPRRRGVDALETVDEVAIVSAPGYTDPASYDDLLTHCEKMQDRVAILDGPCEDIPNLDVLTKIAEVPAPGSIQPPGPGRRARASDGGYGALYYPCIVIRNTLNRRELVVAHPSGHIAGIYARTDATRGVHKAPANEIVRGALGLKTAISKEEQGALNVAGVNVIRSFPGNAGGIRVWGARTLAAKPEWKYVPVRRLFCFVEESIGRGTSWAVFEPNDETLWNKIKRDVGAFLTNVWRDGALVGSSPEQAFFVKCDAETNPPESVDLGKLVTEIGIAPVKPAEFVIFRIGQSAAGTEVTYEGQGGEG